MKASRSQTIQVWSLHPRMSGKPHCIVPVIVGKDKDEIAFAALSLKEYRGCRGTQQLTASHFLLSVSNAAAV